MDKIEIYIPMENKIAVLQNKIEEAHAGGGSLRVESQHKKGKLTARERLHFYSTKVLLKR